LFATGGDPVALGLVASLNRPGGNATGIAFQTVELGGKGLGLLHELLPNTARVVAVVDPNSVLTDAAVHGLEEGAAALRLQLEIARAGSHGEIDAALASLSRNSPLAMMLLSMGFVLCLRWPKAKITLRQGARDKSPAEVCDGFAPAQQSESFDVLGRARI
jgi:putative tryptophan/tyrosine transport system substrate-binding protein